MVSNETFRQLALSFPEAVEQAHFENPSFRVRKKIFATLRENEKRAVLKFTELEQSVFANPAQEGFYPVPGGWGKMGYTFVELSKVTKAQLMDALTVSYGNVAPKKLLVGLKPAADQ